MITFLLISMAYKLIPLSQTLKNLLSEKITPVNVNSQMMAIYTEAGIPTTNFLVLRKVLGNPENEQTFDLVRLLCLQAVSALSDCYSLFVMKTASTSTAILAKKHIPYILSLMMFGLVHRCISRSEKFSNMPSSNFERLFSCFDSRSTSAMEAKIKCILGYIQQTTQYADNSKTSVIVKIEGSIHFGVFTDDQKNQKNQKNPLNPSNPVILIKPTGGIESTTGILADFANKHIGGGTLGRGSVQEEILFAKAPELIALMLFIQELADTSVAWVRGFRFWSKGKGYGSNFEYDGVEPNSTPRAMVLLNAIDFSKNVNAQYQPVSVTRELKKAIAAMKTVIELSKTVSDGPDSIVKDSGVRPVFGTGNWGCGIFCGDPQLKLLIQYAAAKITGCNLEYFTFGNAALLQAEEICQIVSTVPPAKVEELLHILCQKKAENLGTPCFDLLKSFS